MKAKLSKLLLALSIACCLGFLSVPTQALAYVRCAWVPGHWQYGHWVPAHRNCWNTGYRYYNRYNRGYGSCWWVPGHWRYGSWVPAHRVCN